MSHKMTTAPSPEELLELVGPEAKNLLGLLKQVKQFDREVNVCLKKAVPLPGAYGFKARALFGTEMPFGGLVLNARTLGSAAGWCWLEIEPCGPIDKEYLEAHQYALFGGMSLLAGEMGAITHAPHLGGIMFVLPA